MVKNRGGHSVKGQGSGRRAHLLSTTRSPERDGGSTPLPSTRSAVSIKGVAPAAQASLLTIPDFCRENSISRSKAYGLFKDGTLKAVKVGRLTRIRRQDAEAWAAALTTYEPAA
jgi:excisionase family DNA binding protein